MDERDDTIFQQAGDARFFDLLLELSEMHAKKSHDYGLSEWSDSEIFIDGDPLFNFRGSVLYGVDPWIGAMIRLQDKVSRLQTLAAGHELTNENARDTFVDLASYALIALLLWEDQEEASEEIYEEDDSGD